MNNCIVCSTQFVPAKFQPYQKYCCPSCREIVANKKAANYKKEWAATNKDKVKYAKQKWLENNPEKRKEASEEYRKRNKAYYTQYASLRSRKVQQAQPKWSNKDDVLNVYKEAEYLGLEVDHIIPITHKLVCGLHVWDNLQLLSRSENAKKSNRFSNDDLITIVRE